MLPFFAQASLPCATRRATKCMAGGTPFHTTTHECWWAPSSERTSICTEGSPGDSCQHYLRMQRGHSESVRRPGLKVRLWQACRPGPTLRPRLDHGTCCLALAGQVLAAAPSGGRLTRDDLVQQPAWQDRQAALLSTASLLSRHLSRAAARHTAASLPHTRSSHPATQPARLATSSTPGSPAGAGASCESPCA